MNKQAVLSTTAGLLTCALAGVLPAQDTGNFADIPFGLMWEMNTGGTPEIMARGMNTPGIIAAVPQGNSSHAGFTITEIWAALQSYRGEIARPDIKSITSFNDQLPVAADSNQTRIHLIDPQMNAIGWATIFVTTDQLSPNNTQPNPILQQQATLGPIGSEAIGYYFGNNAGMPAGLHRQTRLEVSRTQMWPIPTNATANLGAMDWAIPNIVRWPDQQNMPPEMEVNNRVAFSVSAQYVNQLSAPLPLPYVGGGTRNLHATSVVSLRWNSTTNNWGSLEILFDYRDSEDRLSASDELDGLAIGDVPVGVQSNLIVPNDADFFLLSTSGATRPQLLAYHPPTGLISDLFVADTGSTTVLDDIDLGAGEDITNICCFDPEGFEHGRICGTPMRDRNNVGGNPNVAPSFLISTHLEPPKDFKDKTRQLNVFASGAPAQTSAVLLFFGQTATPTTPQIPLSLTGRNYFLLGTWGPTQPVFRASTAIPDDRRFDMVLVVGASSTNYVRSVWSGIRS